jgi:hypothetical protein
MPGYARLPSDCSNKGKYRLHIPRVQLSTPVVFPLLPILPDGTCGCGDDRCERVGKHPAVAWGEIEYGSEVPRPAPGAGVGLKTGAQPRGSGIIVVDLDGPDALEAWGSLGGHDGDTLTVSTPRTGGGIHLYFEHPGFHVRNSVGALAPGIDIRGEGGFVVAPGSPHRSGGTYELVVDVPPAPAPAWLLERLRAQTEAAPQLPAQHYPGDVTDPAELEHRRGLFVDHCKRAPIGLAGNRHMRLFPVVQRGAFDLQLPADVVHEVIAEHFNPRCRPPMGDAELRVSVLGHCRGAKTQSTKPRVEPLPRDLAHLVWPGTDGIAQADTDIASAMAMAAGNPAPAPKVAAPDALLPIIWGHWNEPTVPPPYLLDGLIPEGKVVTFFAEGGSVKTWAAFALGISVATGHPWLSTVPVRKGRALFIDFEDGRAEFKRRRELLVKGGAAGPVADGPGGAADAILKDLPDLGYLYAQASLLDPETWRYLATLGLKLLIVDSLAAATPGDVDENDRAFAESLKLAGLFTTATNCTVVFIHHANKQGGMRGSSAIRDQSDVVFRFEPVSETDDVKRMRMVCDKPGPQKRPAPVNIELSDEGLRTFEDEAADAGRNANGTSDVKEAIRLALRQAALTKDYVFSERGLRERVKGRNTTVKTALAELEAAGEVILLPVVGYCIESKPAARGRVAAVMGQVGRLKTKKDLADLAHVAVDYVSELLAEGALIKVCPGTKHIIPTGQTVVPELGNHLAFFGGGSGPEPGSKGQ